MAKGDKDLVLRDKMDNVIQELQVFFDTEKQICNEAINAQNHNQLTTQRIKERMKIVSEALVLTNTVMANEKESSKTEKDTRNVTPARNANDKGDNKSLVSNQQRTIVAPARPHASSDQSDIASILSYINDPSITNNLQKLKDGTEGLVNAYNKHTFPQYIMDMMIINIADIIDQMLRNRMDNKLLLTIALAPLKILDKLIDITGGHLADIHNERVSLNLIRPNLIEHQKSLDQAIHSLENYQTTNQGQLIGQLNDLSKTLDLKKQNGETTDQFINRLETSVIKYLQAPDPNKQRQQAKQLNIDVEKLDKLYEEAMTHIRHYRQIDVSNSKIDVPGIIASAKNSLLEVKQAIKILDNKRLPHDISSLKKEVKTRQKKTYTEKVQEQNVTKSNQSRVK